MGRTFSGGDRFELACTFLGETDKAVKILEPVSGEEHWIPFSTVHEMHRPVGGIGEGTIVMDLWLAQKRGFTK